MIYFDNAASTYRKPDCVINAVKNSLIKYTANPGRSGHSQSIESGNQISIARETVKNYFNAYDIRNVVFTKGCSEALNLAIIGNIKKNGHIIITTSEHNSVIRPIFEMKEKYNLEISIVNSKNGKITLKEILKHVKKNTYMICTNHISNVDGTIAEVEKIGLYCKNKKIMYLVDGAQSAGHFKIDVKKSNIDLFTIAGHKGLYAPQGVGCLIFSDKAKPYPIIYGGTGTESINQYQPLSSPECFESGTLATPAILGLNEGINFVKRNEYLINKHISELTYYCIKELSKIDEVKCYTRQDNQFGVISFNILNFDSGFVSDYLNENYQICSRSGLHCAPLKHKELQTVNQGTVRISFSFYNTKLEIDKFILAIKNFIKDFT